MATGQRRDPLRNFRFRVEIDGIMQAGFSEATGFDATTDVIDYREGNEPTHVRKLPGLTKYGNISLKYGITDNMELYNWHKEISNGNVKRKNISIIIVDEVGNDKARWEFVNTWLSKYDSADLNAKGNDVAIETIEIVHEGMTRVI
ncbi:phage tail protein [Bacillus pseudomycoides]|uniref:phage tail protein n=1 Tax=Bacillus pseudomycoides TaxID=64104 RepID=UPI000BEDCD69|nr:phage tail protein [Bacillus pseudomycoides]MBD5799855.1 phage tail protein [Bacillus pseudomycoides]MED1476523.1 phage tail protein [Bacillus pseudomycoides]PDZ13442.1 phage tail protein [Bacillus pseudomycoides]PEO83564.1 phage tail protein [Bacillus pseudomycoides]